jgi:hypothetical protein
MHNKKNIREKTMRAREIIFHFISILVLLLSTVIGLAGAEDVGGYLWELMCIVSPLLLGIELHVLYLKFKHRFLK